MFFYSQPKVELMPPRLNPGRPRDFDGNMQCIASVAHRRGVIITRSRMPVGFLDAATLCKALRTAHEHQPDHVATIANSLALSIGPRGSLEVPQATLNVLRGYVNKAAATPAKVGA